MAKKNECVAYLTHNSHAIEGSGCSCSFYVYKGMGIKCFHDKYDAIKAYKMQRRLHKHGIAPRVLSKLHSYNNTYEWEDETHKVFFFLTEIAEVYMYGVEMEEDYDEDGIYDDPEHQAIQERLEELDLYDYDAHDENYGYIDGRLVVIDTGSIG